MFAILQGEVILKVILILSANCGFAKATGGSSLLFWSCTALHHGADSQILRFNGAETDVSITCIATNSSN